MKPGAPRALACSSIAVVFLTYSNTSPAIAQDVPHTGSYVFEVEDFGKPTGGGVFVATTGDVYRYINSLDRPDGTNSNLPPGDEDARSQSALDRKFRQRTLISRIPMNELKAKILSIVPASNGQLVQIQQPPTAMSARTYIAYLYDEKTQSYRPIKLRQASRAGLMQTNSQAGKQLAAWLDQLMVPDRLTASCISAGLPNLHVTVSIWRDGTVEKFPVIMAGSINVLAPRPEFATLAQSDVEPIFERLEALDAKSLVEPSSPQDCVLTMRLHGVLAHAVIIPRGATSPDPATPLGTLADDISVLTIRTFSSLKPLQSAR